MALGITTLHATCLQKLHWFPITKCIEYKVARMCFYAINDFGPSYPLGLIYVYTLSHMLYSLSNSHILEIQQCNTNAKCIAFALVPSLGLTFGTQSPLILSISLNRSKQSLPPPPPLSQ